MQGEFVFMHLDKQGLGAYNEEKTKEVTQCCTLKLWNRICNPQSRIDGLSLLYLFVDEKNSHRLCFCGASHGEWLHCFFCAVWHPTNYIYYLEKEHNHVKNY